MFNQLNPLPADPLLGLITAFNNDPREPKVDLGVGVYRDEHGVTPIMAAIAQAAKIHLATENSKAYINPAGAPGFIEAMTELVYGEDNSIVTDNRVTGIQTPGGCGALRVGADLLKRLNKPLTVWVSDPTWANHIPLMSASGHQIKTYPYYNAKTGLVEPAAMMEVLSQLGPDDVVLLHGCCHNPTGADLAYEDWLTISDIAAQRGFLPYVDIAYQGLGDDLETDVAGVRTLAGAVSDMLISVSCSKNFGLYRDRTGAILVQTASAKKAEAALTQIKDVARSSYSMPPAYGGFLVDIVLSDDTLKQQWKTELAEMAKRVKDLRSALQSALEANGIAHDFSFITQQKGMFSYLGIAPEPIRQLKQDYAIYMAGSSRINVAGLTLESIDYVADSIKAVL